MLWRSRQFGDKKLMAILRCLLLVELGWTIETQAEQEGEVEGEVKKE
jgi:hypothetical protein